MEDLRDFRLNASHQFQSSLLGFLEILSQFIGEVRQAWSLDCSDSHTEFVSKWVVFLHCAGTVFMQNCG